MPEFTRYPKGSSRTLINFNRVIDQLDNAGDIILCLPIGLVGIIRMLLKDRGSWRSSYVIEQDDFGYTKPTFAEFEPVQNAIDDFLRETNVMNCQGFIQALNDIASAIRSSSCCAPGQNTSYVDDDGVIYYGSQQPVSKPTEFGEGQEFATEEEFSSHLCSAANNIVSGLILSLNNWSILSLASLTAGGLIVAIFVANPPLGLFIALAAAGFAFAVFSQIAGYISSHRGEWVCAIYNATGYSNMLVHVDTLIDELVLELEIGPFSVPITELIHAMINTDTFNKAYTNVGLPEPIGAVSCENCEPDDLVEVLGILGAPAALVDGQQTGLVPIDGQYHQLFQPELSSNNRCYVEFRYLVEGVAANIEMDISDITINFGGQFYGGAIVNKDGQTLKEYNDPPIEGVYDAYQFTSFAADASYTVTVKFTRI